MPILQLGIKQFRNLTATTLEPQAGMNIFYGQNGSGKTSILEAIYFLGLGRSFRTHLTHRVIQHNAPQFLLFAQLQQGDQVQAVGIEQSRQTDKKIRINGETITSLAPLAQQLPLQLLTTESHRYFHDGPKPRRQFLDQGVFHVEPCFYPVWQRFQKALKQRNASLKNQLAPREIEVWNPEIAELSALFDAYRKKYITELQFILTDLLRVVLPEADLELRYTRGWSQEEDMLAVLTTSLSRDRQLGYTQFGPQRADLQLYMGKTPVFDFLSQGQQKSAAYALHLAQGILLHKRTRQTPTYLIDDLPSELDPEKRNFMSSILKQLQAQVFITSITVSELSDMLSTPEAQTFHVEHGQIQAQPRPL